MSCRFYISVHLDWKCYLQVCIQVIKESRLQIMINEGLSQFIKQEGYMVLSKSMECELFCRGTRSSNNVVRLWKAQLVTYMSETVCMWLGPEQGGSKCLICDPLVNFLLLRGWLKKQRVMTMHSMTHHVHSDCNIHLHPHISSRKIPKLDQVNLTFLTGWDYLIN